MLILVAFLYLSPVSGRAGNETSNMPFVEIHAGEKIFSLGTVLQRVYYGYAGDRRDPIEIFLKSGADATSKVVDRLWLGELTPDGDFEASLTKTGSAWYVAWRQRSCSDCEQTGLIFADSKKLQRVVLSAKNFSGSVPAQFAGETQYRIGGRYGFDVKYRLDGADVCFDRAPNSSSNGLAELDELEAQDSSDQYQSEYEGLLLQFGPEVAKRILGDIKENRVKVGNNLEGSDLSEEAKAILGLFRPDDASIRASFANNREDMQKEFFNSRCQQIAWILLTYGDDLASAKVYYEKAGDFIRSKILQDEIVRRRKSLE